MVGLRGGELPRPKPLQLCGRPIPWVERAEHLGYALHQNGLMLQDCKEKWAQMINSSVKIRESFAFARPSQQILPVTKYFWDLGSREAEMLTNAWRTGQKLAWDAPRHLPGPDRAGPA